MSKRKITDGSRWVLVSGWLGLLVYGCSTPADGTDDGRPGTGGGTSGSAGSGFSGAFSGSAGTVSGSAGVGVGGTPATGGAAGVGVTGGTAGVGVTGGTAGVGVTGGTAGDGMTGGAAGTGTTGGAAGTGTTGGTGGGSATANNDPECTGIRTNMPCTLMGKACPNMACGLGDTGRRDCNCATNWTCTSCSFVGSVIQTKPANAETPCSGVTNGEACAVSPGMAESVCNNSAATPDDPYCMCATDPRNPANPPEWNCDSAPSSWGM
jgi:hypothetical protein